MQLTNKRCKPARSKGTVQLSGVYDILARTYPTEVHRAHFSTELPTIFRCSLPNLEYFTAQSVQWRTNPTPGTRHKSYRPPPLSPNEGFYTVSQKVPTFKLSVKLNRFSKFRYLKYLGLSIRRHSYFLG